MGRCFKTGISRYCITDWTQASEPSTDDGQYINEKTAHKNMMAYNPSVSYVGELIPNNEFVRHVYEVGKKKLSELSLLNMKLKLGRL